MSTLIIGDKQVLPEKPEMVTGYTVNTTYVPVRQNNRVFIYRCGSIVQIQCDWAGGVNIPGATAVFAITGLPRPAEMLDLQITTDGAEYRRCWIDWEGKLVIFINPAYTGGCYLGGTYITKD